MRITTFQYQIELLSDWEAYTKKITALVLKAKNVGTKLILLPEYAGAEIVCNHFETEQELFKAIQPLLTKYLEFYSGLAQEQQLYLQPGTIMFEIKPGFYVNRAYFFGPDGKYDFQDKLQLIEFEKSTGVLQPGEQQKLFATQLGKIGIAVCYDCEFPTIVRKLVSAGADLILVPSYTSSMAGYNRVYLCCRARAIENQCFVVLSCVVNKVDLSANTDQTFGQAGIFGPADNGFPDDGILVQGQLNQTMMVSADIALEKLAIVRKNGQVHNHEDTNSLRQHEMILLTL